VQTASALEVHVADKTVYDVKIPKTQEEKEKGLMFVREMPQNQGMLFDLRGYPFAAMWMKNTYIPLDMLFIDCDFKVVDIYENAEPLSLKKISSNKSFCYVLEINGGETKKHNILIGDQLKIHSS